MMKFKAFACLPEDYPQSMEDFKNEFPKAQIVKQVDSCFVHAVDMPTLAEGGKISMIKTNKVFHAVIIYFND